MVVISSYPLLDNSTTFLRDFTILLVVINLMLTIIGCVAKGIERLRGVQQDSSMNCLKPFPESLTGDAATTEAV